MTTRRRVLAGAGAVGLAGVGLVGAQGGTAGKARVRFLHASPGAPAVDVLVDGERVVEGLTFGNATDYLSVAAGRVRVQVVPAGAGPDRAIIDAVAPLKPDTDYTVAVAGRPGSIEPLLFVDDNTSTPDRARLRFVHLSPDAPAVDLVTGGGQVLASGVEFGEASDYVELAAPEDYQLFVRPSAGGPAVASFVVDVAAGSVTSLFALGFASPANQPPALSVLTTTDFLPPAATAQVRVVHASPGAPAVDVFVDGERVLEGLEFSEVSDYLEVPAGTRTVAVAPAGAPARRAILTAEVTFEGETAYTVAAAGRPRDIEAIVFVDDNTTVADRARLRFVHLSPDAPAVDLVTGGGLVLASGVEFGEASDYVELPAPEDYRLFVRPSAGGPAVASFVVDVAAGSVTSLFALGFVQRANRPPGFDVVAETDVAPPVATPTANAVATGASD